MEISGILNAVFRWLHVIAGVMWIGHLWFFNFVNIPFGAKMKEAGVSKTVVPELMPRALFWFRWGAAWTWITGVVLLVLVFYHGGILFEPPATWGPAAFLSLALVFGGVAIYDALYKSPLGANARVAHSVSFALIVAVTLIMAHAAHFTFRAYNIHVGTMFGTIMAFNVWFRIWPAQQTIIKAVKGGDAADPALLAMAGSRSRHNTYLSVPLLWVMLDQHTAATQFASWGYVGLFVMILLGWHLVFQLYNRSGKVQGF